MGGSESKWREISLLPEPNAWTVQVEKKLRNTCVKGANDMKILVLGPTQHGKSSLVNSMMCAMTGTINQYVLPSRSDKSVTRSLNSPNVRVNGQPLRFRLTDMPGIFREMKHADEYLTAVFNGHIKEDKVVPEGPLDKDADYYNKNPGKGDLPCCVVLVIKAGKPLDDDLRNKFELIIRSAETVRLKVAVVLTHVDNLGRSLTGKNVVNMFHEKAVHQAVLDASNETGLPLHFIHPVVNYSHEMETISEMNILLLYTLSKILHMAEEGAHSRRH